jgi:hypothetical protein
MKKLLLVFIYLLLYGCKDRPKIPISNTLEIVLDNHNKYSEYVTLLNKASEEDSIALLNFFKIDYINDAAGYDHGFMLLQLLKIYGDKKFANVLQMTTDRDLNMVSQYFEVGIDSNSDHQNEELKRNYPISSDILNIR